MTFLAINLIFRCCVDEVQYADENNPYQITVNYQPYLFSNKQKLFQHPRETMVNSD